jgi:signal transduction histidine kinase
MSVLQIPNILNDTPHQVEAWYHTLDTAALSAPVWDMGAVDFVRPYGVLALLLAARRAAQAHGQPILLRNLAGNIRAYLWHMRVLQQVDAWLQMHSDGDHTAQFPPPQSHRVLELTWVRGPQDVGQIVARAAEIFARQMRGVDLRHLLSVLSELCANVYQHSGDAYGCALIQTYHSRDHTTRVRLAVGDLGVGIRQSLRDSTRAPQVADDSTPAYLMAAFGGQSSRATGRGGLGLRLVSQAVRACGGSLWLRSDDAALELAHSSAEPILHTALPAIGGTQVAVELWARGE